MSGVLAGRAGSERGARGECGECGRNERGARVARAVRGLDVPMVYVRKEARGIGPSAQIVGEIRTGERVLLVDDMMAAGRSKAVFCAALSEAGAVVRDLLVLFDYGTFPTQAVLSR